MHLNTEEEEWKTRKMNNWRKPCEHGVYVGEHSTENWVWGATYWEPGKYVLDEASVCPGGSPVSAADLEANEELVERIAEALYDSNLPTPRRYDKDLRLMPFDTTLQPDIYRDMARLVLAALIPVDAK